MKNLFIIRIIIAMLPMVALSASAGEYAYIMSVPYAVSGENIYKIRIEEIDDEIPRRAIKHRITSGDHVITLSLVLEVEWTPNLPGAQETPFLKKIDMTIEGGMTYQIAAKVNVDAPLESQLDGSFWEPVIYRSY